MQRNLLLWGLLMTGVQFYFVEVPERTPDSHQFMGKLSPTVLVIVREYLPLLKIVFVLLKNTSALKSFLKTCKFVTKQYLIPL